MDFFSLLQSNTFIIEFSRIYLAVFYTFVAVFYTVRINYQNKVNVSAVVFSEALFSTHWWNHSAFKVFIPIPINS